MNLGYIVASREVTENGKSIGYMYRELTEAPDDSGWRVFSGEETQDYADDPGNFAMYNASTIVGLDPSIAPCLDASAPVAFARDDSGHFVDVSGEVRG
ncbi:MAG: DUF2185 domain-containing protein [Deltaproteobacteria bacterium]